MRRCLDCGEKYKGAYLRHRINYRKRKFVRDGILRFIHKFDMARHMQMNEIIRAVNTLSVRIGSLERGET